MFSTPPIHMEQTYICEESYSSPAAIFWDLRMNKATEPFRKILSLTGIPENLPLIEIVTLTQKKWLRSGERAVAADSQELAQIQASIIEQARALQMIETIEPKSSHFSSVLVMGSKLPVVEKRLKSVLEKAVTFDTLYILSGERKLDQDEIDALTAMGSDATDEREMTAFIAKKRIKESSSVINYKIIKANKKEGAVRATTEDTYKAWLTEKEGNSTDPVLLVSSQPYGYYQLLIAEQFLPDEKIELLAVETKEQRAIIFLDTLARILYTIQSKMTSQTKFR